jgi:starch synthase
MSRKLRRTPVASATPRIRALWICPELAPFTSSSLSDEISSLARWLRASDVEPTLVVPRWKEITPSDLNIAKRLLQVEVRFPTKNITAEVWEGRLAGGVRVFFLEHPELFAPFHSQEKSPDDPGKWAFLTRGALDLAQKLALQPEIVHSHGWQSALAPYFLQKQKAQSAKSLVTMYDIREHGSYPKNWVDLLGLGWDGFHLGGFEFFDKLSFLKAGIAYADYLTTTSPSYTKEIQVAGGAGGLEGLLSYRGDRLRGINHGIDYDHWNPQSDISIAQTFSTQDFNGRRRCKAELQRIFRLPVREGRPVLAFIAKTSKGSGLESMLSSLEQIVSMGFEVVCSLDGDDATQRDALIQLAHQRPDAVGVSLDNNERLQRKMIAGADFFAFPDAPAPSAAPLMRAMHYGAVPIARSSGNVLDLVEDASAPTGNGFLFGAEEGAFFAAVQRAQRAYSESRNFRAIQQRGMSRDVSLSTTSAQYRELYYAMLNREIPSTKEEELAASSFVEKLANRTKPQNEI